ncbi:MAG: hypothetical protein ACO3IN_12955, partial [Steroidobacteraceae bacterium]
MKKGKVGGPAVERERALSEDEIKKLARQLPSAKLHLRAETAIWLILATAVRVGELMGAVWGDDLPTDARKRTARLDDLSKQAEAAGVKLGIVDLGSRQWYLPQTNNQRDHTVHLSDFALGRLRTLAEMR